MPLDDQWEFLTPRNSLQFREEIASFRFLSFFWFFCSTFRPLGHWIIHFYVTWKFLCSLDKKNQSHRFVETIDFPSLSLDNQWEFSILRNSLALYEKYLILQIKDISDCVCSNCSDSSVVQPDLFHSSVQWIILIIIENHKGFLEYLNAQFVLSRAHSLKALLCSPSSLLFMNQDRITTMSRGLSLGFVDVERESIS